MWKNDIGMQFNGILIPGSEATDCITCMKTEILKRKADMDYRKPEFGNVLYIQKRR